METLDGTSAIITGGGSGIGRATSISLARRGARVLVADINDDGARETATLINESGGNAFEVRVDVAQPDAFETLKREALDRFGAVDIVMNNVGVLTRGRPDALPVQEWERIFGINLLPVVRSNAVFLPMLIAQGHGHIVNTASFAGLFTYAYDRLPYAASKAAIVQISEGLRLYLEPQGVGVTVLCPGPVATNIITSLPPTFGPEVGTRGPGEQYQIRQPETVGEQVAEAVLQNTFMLYTDDQVQTALVERATDWNAFMAKQVEAVKASAPVV